MATFPALTPNARSLGIGNYPQQEFVGPDGVSLRFLNGTKRVFHKLTLSYVSLIEADINAIYNHYADQQGTLIPFDLPPEVWAGYGAVPVDAVDYQWRYASALTIEPSGLNRFSTTVDLESVIA